MNVPTGYTALDMIGFTDKGVYNSATAYVKNDIVHYNGNLWKCLVDDTTAVTPAEGASWTVFLAEPTSAAEDIIATVEPSVVSTHQYTAGKQLILNDILYTVTAAVNIGDTLAVGTNIVASDTIVEQLTTKANTSSLATVATSGSYADLSNKPTLGTAAAKDVPDSGNASTTEVVMGDDTRLSDARNAADVYPWAKAANKPIYNGSEINTSAAQTGTAQSAVAATIASGTSMDAAIGDLLDNDVTINTDLGNVKQALSDEVSARSQLGAHNILPLSLERAIKDKNASTSVNGNVLTYLSVTATIATDDRGFVKEIVVNGASSNSNNVIFLLLKDLKLPAGTYILSGCPSGGGTNGTFRAYLNDGTDSIQDNGTGVEFTTDGTKVYSYTIWQSGIYTANNIKFYPMIKLKSDPDTTFRPYVPTNAQLLSYKDNGVLGAKNLLKNFASTAVEAGVNCNVTSDGRVVCTRVSSSSSDCLFAIALHTSYTLPKGSYHLSGCPTNVSGNPYGIQIYKYVSGSLTFVGVDIGSGLDFTLSEDTGLLVRIAISSSYNAQNLEFKPMIRLASDTDPTYQPYAMTNRELTEDVELVEYDTAINVIQSRMTINSQKMYKQGKYVTIVLEFVSNLSDPNVLYGGVLHHSPKDGANYTGVFYDTSDYSTHIVQVSNVGSYFGGVGSFTSGHTFRGSITYVTN